jgi:hypothetical protein
VKAKFGPGGNIMNTKQQNSFHHDLALGKIEKESYFNKFGKATVGTGLTTIWTGANSLYVYPTAAVQMDLVSAEAADTQTIHIYGLDKNWKLQDEIVQLNGTTPVTTIYSYFRVFRMLVEGDGDLTGKVTCTETGETTPVYAEILAGPEFPNQTQMAVYTVPAGYKQLVDNLEFTTYGNKKTNVLTSIRDWNRAGDAYTPVFRTVSNWNLINSASEWTRENPVPIGPKVDMEIRGFTETGTDSVSAQWHATSIQTNSVPVDIENFSLSSGDGIIIVTWDEQTPAEVSDAKGFEIELLKDGISVDKKLLTTTSSAYTFTGLDNGTEYTVKLTWVGYDNLRGEVESGTATPAVPSYDIPVTVGLFNASGYADGNYLTSDDDGVTWDESAITGATGYNIREVESDGITMYARLDDGVLDKTATSADAGLTWSIGDTIGEFCGDEYIIYAYLGGVQSTNIVSGVWTATNVTEGISGCAYDGTKYIVGESSGDVKSSVDGITYASLGTPGITDLRSIAASSSLVVAAEQRDATTFGFKYYNGAWNTATTTIATVDADDMTTLNVDYVGSNFVSIVYKTDFSASTIYTSADGDTWSTVATPGTSLLAYFVKTVDGIMYMALVDASFNTWMSTSTDGTTWSEPVQANTNSLVASSIA